MKNKTFKQNIATLLNATLGIAILALVATPTYAQQLEEVVVTAQKRVERLQDVPISVSAISGKTMSETGVENLDDLAYAVPNFIVKNGALTESITIRGISSGSVASIEQSVGIFVDGVYRGRGIQALFSFLDVDRVEVLRGPQAALFGKNTIAGALNISSAAPTEEFEAGISGLYEFEHEEIVISAFASGPISDTFRARLAIEGTDLGDGWLKNNYPGYSANPTREEIAGRLSLEWDATESLAVKLKYEHGDWDNTYGYDQIEIAPTFAAVPRLAGIPVDTTAGNSITTIGNNTPAIDYGDATVFKGDTDEVMLRADYEFSKGTVTVIAAHSRYDFDRLIDADFIALDGIGYEEYEEFEQNSIELRFTSETGNKFEYLAGFYYQDHELDSLTVSEANLRLSDSDSFGALAVVRVTAQLIGRGLPPAAARAGAIAAVGAEDQFARVNFINQEGDTWAVFGQGTLNLRDNLRATIGLRYNEESKKATQGSHCAAFDTFTPDPSSCTAIAHVLFEFDNHVLNLDRSESNLTYSFNLAWNVNEDIMLYATHSKGIKGGGFNSFALRNDPDDAEFEEEKALAYEIGAKLSLLDGTAELNVAGFFMDYTDQQAVIFTGATSFTVENAAGADVSGFELDGRWQLTDSLMLRGSAAYLDFEYTEYLGAACTTAQVATFRAAGGTGVCTQDLSGKTTLFAPELSASLALEHEINIGSSLLLRTVADVSWSDDYFVNSDLDPVDFQKDYALLNLSVALVDRDGRWSLAFLARNLTDETYLNYGNDTPLFDGNHQGSFGRPASYAIRANLRF